MRDSLSYLDLVFILSLQKTQLLICCFSCRSTMLPSRFPTFLLTLGALFGITGLQTRQVRIAAIVITTIGKLQIFAEKLLPSIDNRYNLLLWIYTVLFQGEFHSSRYIFTLLCQQKVSFSLCCQTYVVQQLENVTFSLRMTDVQCVRKDVNVLSQKMPGTEIATINN